MKIYTIAISFIFSSTLIFTQEIDEKTFNEFSNMVYQSMEAERLKKQSEINSYEQLDCTFWTPEIQNEDLQFNTGYIFLPNKKLLIVGIVFEMTGVNINDGSKIGIFNIYSIYKLCNYSIANEKIIIDFGLPIAYLKDNFLFFSYDEISFEKYRLEDKFENSIGSASTVESGANEQ
jgi:hypothetical protein